MKKIISLFLCILLISGCSKASTKHITKDSSFASINDITYEQLQDKLDSNDLFVLYVGRSDCRDCREFEPILESYLNENKGVYLYYLDIKEIRDASKKEDASQEEIDAYDKLVKDLEIEWVPSLKLVNKGEIIDEYTYLSEEYYEIKDSEEKQQAKEKYISEFKTWMSNIYK